MWEIGFMPPSPAPLATAAKRASGFKRPFAIRYDILKAGVSELASTLRLSRDTDQVLFTEVPEPFSPEAARMALISDASGFVMTRFVAIADCVSNAHRFKSYCSEQFISAHVVENLSAFTLAERIIASQQRAAASSFQQALFIPRIGSPHRAVVCPLRDIVDRLAPHSFPINFSFKQLCSGLSAKPDASAQPAPQCSAGLCFSDDVLAFTHLNTLIFRRSVNNVHQDVVVGSGDSGCKDGTRDEALFSSPSGIHFDARHGGWLIADTLNHCVRCVDPSALTVSTVSSLPFVRIASSSSVPTRTVPPVQLSHNPVKQLVFLAMRRAVSQLNLPIKLTHALEWIMTSLHFGRGMSGWRLGMSVSLEQFSEMSRFFRISEINSISHVPMWRPQRIYSDGSGGYVVVSQGRFVLAMHPCL